MPIVVVVRRAWFGAILAGALIGTGGHAATTVAACRTEGEARPQVRVIDGGSRAGEGCDIRRIGVAREDIVWTGDLPRRPHADEEVVLISSKGRPTRAEIRPVSKALPKPPALPLGAPLLPRMTVRPFGAEARVDAGVEGQHLVVSCRTGGAPAGVVLDPGGARLPRGASFRLTATSTGEADFLLSVVPWGQDAGAGAPLLPARQTEIATGQAGDGRVQFVLLCPQQAAHTALYDLSLVPEPAGGKAVTTAWVWDAKQWRTAPERLLDMAAARGIERLHVALEIVDGGVRDAASLARFVALASGRGIAVDAVEGDPEMVRPEGARHAIERARAIAAYQRNAPPQARLAGVQYDIEPYLLPEFGSDPAAVLSAWGSVVEKLSEALALPVDLVLPFWLIDMPVGEVAMDRIRHRLRQVTVMSYRTDPDLVGVISESTLAWGRRHDIPVHVALEMGPLDDETEERFRPSSGGRLVVAAMKEGAAVLLLRRDAAVADALMLQPRNRVVIAASRLSFLGDETAMLAAAQSLRRVLPAWPSFGGISLHGLFGSGH